MVGFKFIYSFYFTSMVISRYLVTRLKLLRYDDLGTEDFNNFYA
jgi:hypothetical protein